MKGLHIRAGIKAAASYGMRLPGAGKMVGALTGRSGIPAIVSYHRVVEHLDESSRTSIPSMLISIRMFEQHLDWIGRHYEFVSLDAAAKDMESGARPGRPRAVVAFDDGYGDVYLNAFPILVRKGIPATVFAVSGLVGTRKLQTHDNLYLLLNRAFSIARQTPRQLVDLLRNAGVVVPAMEEIARIQPNAFLVMGKLLDAAPQVQAQRMLRVLEREFGCGDDPGDELMPMSWEMIEKMQSAGMTIGSHGRTHALLSNESGEKVSEEVALSRQELESRLRVKVQHFAYPDGRRNPSVVAAVAAAGYRFAYGTCWPCDPEYPLMTIPRKVLWEKSAVDSGGRFSPGLMACQLNGAFELGSRCTHDHASYSGASLGERLAPVLSRRRPSGA